MKISKLELILLRIYKLNKNSPCRKIKLKLKSTHNQNKDFISLLNQIFIKILKNSNFVLDIFHQCKNNIAAYQIEAQDLHFSISSSIFRSPSHQYTKTPKTCEFPHKNPKYLKKKNTSNPFFSILIQYFFFLKSKNFVSRPFLKRNLTIKSNKHRRPAQYR